MNAYQQALLSKFPALDHAWSEPVQAAWWRCYALLKSIPTSDTTTQEGA